MVWLLSIHAASTLALAGLIWFVQIVHYPLMRSVGVEAFPAYERRHVQLTGRVVGPLMLCELLSTVALVLAPGTPSRPLAVAGLVMLALVWGSTWGLQVPCHRRLEQGFDGLVVDRLVRTNWIRTFLWTGRGAVALMLLGASP